MIKYLSTLAFLTLVLNANGQQHVDTTEVPPLKEADIVERISMKNLIATPEKYDGKKIQVSGYLDYGWDSSYIYLNKKSYIRGVRGTSFDVNFSQKVYEEKNLEDYNYNYVVIVGTFHKDAPYGTFNGVIDDIIKLDFLK